MMHHCHICLMGHEEYFWSHLCLVCVSVTDRGVCLSLSCYYFTSVLPLIISFPRCWWQPRLRHKRNWLPRGFTFKSPLRGGEMVSSERQCRERSWHGKLWKLLSLGVYREFPLFFLSLSLSLPRKFPLCLFCFSASVSPHEGLAM